jgi:hypothetical protein
LLATFCHEKALFRFTTLLWSIFSGEMWSDYHVNVRVNLNSKPTFLTPQGVLMKPSLRNSWPKQFRDETALKAY